MSLCSCSWPTRVLDWVRGTDSGTDPTKRVGSISPLFRGSATSGVGYSGVANPGIAGPNPQKSSVITASLSESNNYALLRHIYHVTQVRPMLLFYCVISVDDDL